MDKLNELIAELSAMGNLADEMAEQLRARFAELVETADADEIEQEAIAEQVIEEFRTNHHVVDGAWLTNEDAEAIEAEMEETEETEAGASEATEAEMEETGASEAAEAESSGTWDELSYNERTNRIYMAYNETGAGGDVIEIFPAYIIVSQDDGLYRVDYSIADGGLTFGEPQAVRVQYVAAKDSRQPDYSELAVKHVDVDAGLVAGLIIPYFGAFFPNGNPTKEVGRDFHGEYFSPDTELALELYEKRPLFYRHGLDGSMKRKTVGFIDTASLKETPAGIWGQAQLILSDEYRKEIDRLINAGRIFFSSGAAPNLTDVDPLTGEIKEWLWNEASLTPTPANLLGPVHHVKDAGHWDAQRLKLAELVPPMRDRGRLVAEFLKEGRVLSTKTRRLLENTARQIEEALQEIMELLNATAIEIEEAAGAKDLFSTIMEGSAMEIKDAIKDVLAEMRSEEQAAAEKAAQQEEVRAAEIRAGVEATLKELGIDPAAITAAKDKGAQGASTAAINERMEPPEVAAREGNPAGLFTMRTAYDYIDPVSLALGYQCLRARGKAVSTDYVRAMAHRMIEGIKKDESFATGVKEMPLEQFGEYSRTFGRYKGSPRFGRMRMLAEADNKLREFAIKADELLITSGTTYGEELVQEYVGRELISEIQAKVQIVALMNQREVPQGQAMPLYTITGDPTWYYTSETPDADQLGWSEAEFTGRVSTPTTGLKSLQPEKMTAIFAISGELTSQTVLNVVDELREKLLQSAAREMEWLIINAHTQTGATNISDYGNGSISSGWHALSMNGLRYYALVDGSGAKSRDGGTFSAQDFSDTRILLGSRGEDEQTLAYLCDYLVTGAAVNHLAQFETVDKFGANATVVSGKVVETYGSPFFTTSRLPKTDANGRVHNTTANNTKGSLICFRPDQCYIGFRRPLEIHQEYRFIPDATVLGARFEMDFQMGDEDAIGISYNLS